MSKIKELLERFDENLYKVYSPKEIEEDPNISNPDYDSSQIRNIMFGTILAELPYNAAAQDVIDAFRKYIDKMPDEWVVDFLKAQPDTEVEKINEGMWASPIKNEKVAVIKKFFESPITFKELKDKQKDFWNIFGSDSFWDYIEGEVLAVPDADVRKAVAEFLRVWIIRKDAFVKDAFDDEAAKQIQEIIKEFI